MEVWIDAVHTHVYKRIALGSENVGDVHRFLTMSGSPHTFLWADGRLTLAVADKTYVADEYLCFERFPNKTAFVPEGIPKGVGECIPVGLFDGGECWVPLRDVSLVWDMWDPKDRQGLLERSDSPISRSRGVNGAAGWKFDGVGFLPDCMVRCVVRTMRGDWTYFDRMPAQDAYSVNGLQMVDTHSLDPEGVG